MQKSKYSGLIIVLAIVMAICVFLPFMSATEKLSNAIDRAPDAKVYRGLDYTAKDLENPSLFTLMQIGLDLQEKHNVDSDEFTVKLVCTIILVISSLVAAVFASKLDGKKVIIFVVIAMICMFYMIGEMEDGGLDPNGYTYGYGIWVFLAASIAAIVCAVKMKKEIAQAQQSNQQYQTPYAQ